MKDKPQNLYVEIEGISYPAHNSLGAMLLFKKETGKEVNQIDGLSDSIIWLWCCVKSASARTEHPLTMDCQEFADRCTMDVLDEWTNTQRELQEESKKKTPKGSRKGSMSS